MEAVEDEEECSEAAARATMESGATATAAAGTSREEEEEEEDDDDDVEEEEADDELGLAAPPLPSAPVAATVSALRLVPPPATETGIMAGPEPAGKARPCERRGE